MTNDKEEGGVTSASQETKNTLTTLVDNNNTLSEYKNVVTKVEKPKLIIEYDRIPQALKDIKRWMNWSYGSYDEKKGKFNKVPITTGWNDPQNLLPFNEARKVSEESNGCIGIGITTLNAGFTCFDLDGLDFTELKTKGRGIGFITLLDNTKDYYSERSVSGNGLHIIFLDPEHKFVSRLSANPVMCNDCDHIEIFAYDKDRYVAITGNTPYKETIELTAISNPEVENIKEWMDGCDGKKPVVPVKTVTQPLKSITFTPECLPACITCVINRLKNKKGVDHEKRILLASFLLNVGLNLVDVFEYFKDSEDFNHDETMKQLLSVENKVKESGGYNYSCKKIATWKNKDDGTELCDHKCPVETFPKNAYVMRVMNKEIGITITQKPEIENITEEELNGLENSEESKPFEFKLKNSLIAEYIDFHSTQSDAYPDYHHAGALMILSTIVDRKALMELKQGFIYTNVWLNMLGLSSISRKTTVTGQVHNFDYILRKPYRGELPKQFTPESFIEIESETPHSYYINDECADLLKGINKKTYMSDLRDAFCTIYDCVGFTRKLRTKKNDKEKSNFTIKEPYMTALFATTPGNIERFTEYDDMSSGWMIRFLYYYPNYKKKFMSLAKKDINDLNGFNKLLNRVTVLNEFFEKLPAPIEFYFDEEAESYFNKWNEDVENNPTNDDIIRSGISRLIVYAIKLSILYEIADDQFFDKFKVINDHSAELKFGIKDTYPITLEKITEACNEITEYFIPMLERVAVLVEAGDDKEDQQKIINLLKRHGGKIQRGKLAQVSRLSRKSLSDALQVLSEDTNEVKLVIVNTKTKKQEWICLNKNSAPN